jgi:hypothetical protein
LPSVDEDSRVGRERRWLGIRPASNTETFGVTLFSLPGVSSDRTKAMIYIGTSCGTTCGTGYLILLGKDGDHWKVLDKVMIWIS